MWDCYNHARKDWLNSKEMKMEVFYFWIGFIHKELWMAHIRGVARE